MSRIILFDLYDTVLKDISFDFEAGIRYIYNTYFRTVCSFEELKEYEESFLPLYIQRKEKHTEVCLIKEEIPYFFKKFGVEMPDNETMVDLEYSIMNHMQKVTLLDEIKRVIVCLKASNIKMYILSNSIFTGRSARRLLSEFGISDYFCKIYSSADYGIRKPNGDFYQIVIDNILLDNPNMDKTDILYVGNDYNTDVIGATSIGLQTVWYNVAHLPNKNNIPIHDIDSFEKILNISCR